MTIKTIVMIIQIIVRIIFTLSDTLKIKHLQSAFFNTSKL